MAATVQTRPGYETNPGSEISYQMHQEGKQRVFEEEHAWEFGFTRLPKHPAMTGEKKCWLCLEAETEKCLKFEVEGRLDDWVHIPPEQREKDYMNKPNAVKEAQFCNIKCYMEGWPAVRRDYILAGGRAKPSQTATSGAAA